MKVDNCKSPYFGAKYLSTQKIGKLVKESGKYIQADVSFVYIDPRIDSDLEAVASVKYWKDDRFGLNIHYAAQEIRNDSKYYRNHKIGALTSQMDNFEHLDPEKILGLVSYNPSDKGGLHISNLQVNPKYLYESDHDYAGIGTGISDSLKELTDRISVYPAIEQSVRKFYKMNGYYPSPNNCYVWLKGVSQ
jgi:hypothetical protein